MTARIENKMSGPMVLCQLWMGGVSKLFKYLNVSYKAVSYKQIKNDIVSVGTLHDGEFYHECISQDG